MATTINTYNALMKYLLDGTVNLLSDDIKVALCTSAYTPAVTHDVLADISGQLSAGSGYTAGGNALASKTFAFTDSPVIGTFDAADLVWTSLTATFRYGIIYANVTRNTVANPLISWILFDDTPANVVVGGVDFTIYWNASGILTLTNA